jgi:primosomal protein N' (replication factor Y)
MARVCRVLPDLPAVDRAFDYLVPDELVDRVHVGTIVRVSLHGRRVRGWVLELDAEAHTPLDRMLPLRAVVSAGPPPDLVDLSAWAAWRWAGPRVAFLRAASPPNVVTETAMPECEAAVFPTSEPPIDLFDAWPRVVRWPPAASREELVRTLVAPEGSTIVIAPDPREASALSATLESEGRHVVILRGDHSDASRTAMWDAARRGACVVLGGRVAALAPVPDLTAAIVLDDLDEALEEERAPSWHALELVAERVRRADGRLDVISPAPGAHATAAGAMFAAPSREVERRGWARLDIVDVRDEAPGHALLSSTLADSLHRTLGGGGRAICVLNRRGRARLLVCRACGEVARCPECEAAVQEVEDMLACPRCGHRQVAVCQLCGSAGLRARRLGVLKLREHVAALVPQARVVAVESGSAPMPAFDVAIGTEAVLHRAPEHPDRPIRLVAFLDFDQELLAPRYRAEEQALWLLVRASRLVGVRGPGGVVLTQTRMPEHPVVVAARDGYPLPVLDADLVRRRTLQYPPFGGLAEVSGQNAAVDTACAVLEQATALTVFGPASGRALVRAPSVDDLCDALASADLSGARALGRVRVDVDPRRV